MKPGPKKQRPLLSICISWEIICWVKQACTCKGFEFKLRKIAKNYRNIMLSEVRQKKLWKIKWGPKSSILGPQNLGSGGTQVQAPWIRTWLLLNWRTNLNLLHPECPHVFFLTLYGFMCPIPLCHVRHNMLLCTLCVCMHVSHTGYPPTHTKSGEGNVWLGNSSKTTSFAYLHKNLIISAQQVRLISIVRFGVSLVTIPLLDVVSIHWIIQ